MDDEKLEIKEVNEGKNERSEEDKHFNIRYTDNLGLKILKKVEIDGVDVTPTVEDQQIRLGDISHDNNTPKPEFSREEIENNPVLVFNPFAVPLNTTQNIDEIPMSNEDMKAIGKALEQVTIDEKKQRRNKKVGNRRKVNKNK